MINLAAASIAAAEYLPVPDSLLRAAISALVSLRACQLRGKPADAEQDFVRSAVRLPIVLHADAANTQHYELPAEFFRSILGPRLKYSCCLYEGTSSLASAEERALQATAEHAQLADGQSILELGCGWGSLSLWLAERFQNAEIVAVSNSHSQKAHIVAEATRRGLRGLRVLTADVGKFDPGARFDRIVSVEMWEHVANWQALLERTDSWLERDGRLFVHVFSHRAVPYRFDHNDQGDWIGRHFFTGGIMPSHGLMRRFRSPLRVEAEWRWSGRHYQRTALDWLRNYDTNLDVIRPILQRVYGADAKLWQRRWRLFFLAVAQLFGAQGGEEWGVSQYRMGR